MKFFILIALLVGLGAFLFFRGGEVTTTFSPPQKVSETAEEIKEKVSKAVDNISADEIKAEFKKTGRIVRKKAKETGAAIADATQDPRTTLAIKGKYVGDKDLSALNISVNTTAGVVTLSGSVNSYDDVAKAIAIALETEGVQEVISTLQVRE